MNLVSCVVVFFFFKQKTAYEIRRDWSSDVCSSDLVYSKGRKQQPFIIPNPPICTVVPSKAVIIEPGPDGSATSGPFLSGN